MADLDPFSSSFSPLFLLDGSKGASMEYMPVDPLDHALVSDAASKTTLAD